MGTANAQAVAQSGRIDERTLWPSNRIGIVYFFKGLDYLFKSLDHLVRFVVRRLKLLEKRVIFQQRFHLRCTIVALLYMLFDV